LLALALLAAFRQNYRALFVIAFIPAALGVAFLTFVRETGGGRTAVARLPSFSLRQAPPVFRRFLLITLLFALGNSSDVFLILRAQHLGLSTARVVLLFAVFNLTYVLSAYPAGSLSDRLGRKRLLVAGLGVFALVYLGFALASAPGWLWLLFGIYGLYMGLTDGIARAFVVDLVSADQRASALGLYAMATGLAAFPASALGGVLWQWRGPAATFLCGASLAGLAAVLLAGVADRIVTVGSSRSDIRTYN
jgi:MFS family permease